MMKFDTNYIFDIDKGVIDGTPIEYAVANLLEKNNLVISVAESLTGGKVAEKLINVAGISQYFKEGIVAYANDSKVKRLYVKQFTLDTYGAVSSETAKEMVNGLLREGADIAVSTTGIAGPSGGSKEKPVGLVWFGIGFKNQETESVQQIFVGNRENIRNKSANYALFLTFLLLTRLNKGE